MSKQKSVMGGVKGAGAEPKGSKEKQRVSFA